MKILQLVRDMKYYSGTPVQVVHATQAMALIGHDVRVCTMLKPHFSLDLEGCYTEALTDDLDGKDAKFCYFLQEAIRVCKEFEPDIIHAHYPHAMLVASTLKILLNIPFVITFHGYELASTKERWQYRAIRRAILEADCVICISRNLEADIQNHFEIKVSSNWAVIPDSYDERTFVPTRNRRQSGRTVITVSRLVPEKGIMTLVNAFSSVACEYPESVLWIVGEGAHEKELKERVHQLGQSDRMIFKGWASPREVAMLLQEADIFVIPSVKEALGTTLLEALGSGLAVIGSRSGGIPEILQQGGGLLIPPGNEEALRTALNVLLNDDELRIRLGRAAAKIASGYTREIMATRLLSAYSRVIAA
jgi:glycosyltransferase involved in cell wall biosynthesis